MTRCAPAATLLCTRGFIWVVVKTGAKNWRRRRRKKNKHRLYYIATSSNRRTKKTACKTCQKTQTIGIFLNFGVGRRRKRFASEMQNILTEKCHRRDLASLSHYHLSTFVWTLFTRVRLCAGFGGALIIDLIKNNENNNSTIVIITKRSDTGSGIQKGSSG